VKNDIIELLEETHESLISDPSIFDSLIESKRRIAMHCNEYPIITDEFWTSKQRQASSIHEVSYRACFKPQLPNFFINRFTKPGDIVYDPFSGRGTTAIEAALCGRNVIINDVNPLSIMLTIPRIRIPLLKDIESRLASIKLYKDRKADIDLSMFYHPDTESELVSIRDYLIERKANGRGDYVDDWLRMVATNKLTGHSKNFFSVYTLPPNQACSQQKQIEFNEKSGRIPSYKDTKDIIIIKSHQLQKDISPEIREAMFALGEKAMCVNSDAAKTSQIPDSCVSLVVTSPPFLDVIDYAGDNWLRCWFNNIDIKEVQESITVTKKLDEWELFMSSVFNEMYRVIKPGGYIAFEVGEIRKGKIKLEESIVPIGKQAGFEVLAVIINEQIFTKTSNIWGVSNNQKGTNTNRIVILRKPQ
jgi:DNA modification methylase